MIERQQQPFRPNNSLTILSLVGLLSAVTCHLLEAPEWVAEAILSVSALVFVAALPWRTGNPDPPDH